MKTEPQRTCPSCGNELSGAMEFCPVCMLRKALARGVESGESSASEDTVRLASRRDRLLPSAHGQSDLNSKGTEGYERIGPGAKLGNGSRLR